MRNLTKTGRFISNKIGKAIADYNLIEDKDRILVAVSGGKDSLSLLKLLNERRLWAPIKYDIAAVHIESDHRCAGCVHVKALRDIFEKSKIEYHFEKIKIREKGKKVSCFWCSWNRRKALFSLADKINCNKVAFGHHKDDIIETLLLNIFYHGEFAAMNPRQPLFDGKITIIRPLCYVEEGYLRKFAKESAFPTQFCKCPNAALSKRRMVKDFIKIVEEDCSYVKTNLFRSMARVKKDYLDITEEK